MGTITAAKIIDAAAHTLQDTTNTTWTRAELLGYVNDAQRDACVIKPDAYVLTSVITLMPGTRQTLPANGTAFIRLARNMGTDGITPGRVPRPFSIPAMDMQHPNWHFDAPSATVMEVGFDEREPKTFYVSPPQPTLARGQVDAVFSAVPPDMATEAATIALDDIYSTALQHYVCYRAYLKEGELSDNAGAMAHRAEFIALLGAKEEAEMKVEGK